MEADVATRRSWTQQLNRRIAQRVENLDRVFREITGESGECTLLCACGRDDCEELVVIGFAAYEAVRANAHQYVIAPGHATELDEIVMTTERYDVVAIKSEFRPT